MRVALCSNTLTNCLGEDWNFALKGRYTTHTGSVKWLDDGLCKQLPRESPSFISFLTKKPFMYITYRWTVQYRMYIYILPSKTYVRHQSKTAKPMTKVFFCGWIATAFYFRAPPSFSAYQNYFSIFYETYLVETLKKESTFPQKIWGLDVCMFYYFAFMPSGLKNAIYNMLFLHVNCMSTGLLPIIWTGKCLYS